MTEKEKIRAEIERLKDIQSSPIALCNDLISFIDSLPEEPVNKDLEEASYKYSDELLEKNKNRHSQDWNSYSDGYEQAIDNHISNAFIDGAKWQKRNLWKDAQGNDLPEIDREVIVLQGRKVVFSHRPPEYWDGKNIGTGEVTRCYPQTYDKGGWNMEGVTWWLDSELPEGIE